MADTYLLDTNVICALADADRVSHAVAVSRFQQTGGQYVMLPSPAIGEIEFGMQKAPDVRPDKRQELRDFIARFDQLPFDEHCIQPYAIVRAEVWRMFGTPKPAKPHKHDEKRPEDLLDKVTGTQLGIDEPDLYIASIALAQKFPLRLRVENWVQLIS